MLINNKLHYMKHLYKTGDKFYITDKEIFYQADLSRWWTVPSLSHGTWTNLYELKYKNGKEFITFQVWYWKVGADIINYPASHDITATRLIVPVTLITRVVVVTKYRWRERKEKLNKSVVARMQLWSGL